MAGEWEGHVGTWKKRRIKERERGRQVAGAVEETELHVRS